MSYSKKKFAIKNFCVVMLLIFYSFNALAVLPNNDTAQLKKPHKISKKEFLQQYGKDDSTRALINYYFRKRNRSKRGMLVTSGVALLSGIAFDNVVNGNGNEDEIGNAHSIATGLFYGFTFYISTIVVAVHIAILISNSRKKLYKMLEDHDKGISLPPKITRSSLYKKLYNKRRIQPDK